MTTDTNCGDGLDCKIAVKDMKNMGTDALKSDTLCGDCLKGVTKVCPARSSVLGTCVRRTGNTVYISTALYAIDIHTCCYHDIYMMNYK